MFLRWPVDLRVWWEGEAISGDEQISNFSEQCLRSHNNGLSFIAIDFEKVWCNPGFYFMEEVNDWRGRWAEGFVPK